jgi:prepilin-type N-terminal cleavage/methylation domain-containing protein/prepilin-type processing-associated H-X9-DG protein
MYRKPYAFTLIELLVVISIIAVLISLMLPSLTAARETAVAMNCMSRMRGYMVYEEGYRKDYKNWYTVNNTNYPIPPTPPPGPWYRGSFETLIAPYLPTFTWTDATAYNTPRAHNYKLNPYICPTAVMPTDFSATTVRQQGYLEVVYGNYRKNSFFGYGSGDETTLWNYRKPKREIMGAPSLLILFGEWAGGNVAFGDQNASSGCIYRHGDASNLIFADGHGKGYTNITADITTGVYRFRIQ